MGGKSREEVEKAPAFLIRKAESVDIRSERASMIAATSSYLYGELDRSEMLMYSVCSKLESGAGGSEGDKAGGPREAGGRREE